MTYSLDTISKIDDLLCGGENRKEVAKSLNLKYNVWKHKNGVRYHVLKYDKDWLSKELVSSIGMLRSVIFKDDGTVVSFAPPKSLSVDNLSIDSGTDADAGADAGADADKGYVAETFVEGTMINVFYETETNTWELATRSNVGGRTCFFMEDGFKEENTFSYMFNEVCTYIGLDLNDLNKKYMYSFVMQHPRNRIVKIIKNMALYLVNVYHIENNKTIHVVPINNNIEQFGIKSNTVNMVERIPLKSNDDLIRCKDSMASMNTPYDIVGVMIKNNAGERYKFRNPTYEYVRQLRGNQPKLQYQYLSLRQSGKMTEYLQYYKEHKKPFNEFRNVIHAYTTELFTNYIRCYIKKEKELKEFPEKFRTHMFVIHHEIYLKTLMANNQYVDKNVVIQYFNGLHPSKQMFILNYDARKNHIDSKRVANDVTSTENNTA
jgi:hypothetical protein